MATTPEHLPLSGFRVLELGHIVAGPTAGLLLADLGADVIKVEQPGSGDQARGVSGAIFHFLNRNKRSLALDLKSPEGRGIFLQLVQTADVVLDNFAVGVVERLGIDYEHLAAVNSAIIYLSIKGFLPGPYENRPALDEVAQMMGGLAFMTGDRGRPLRAGASVIDMGAAMNGVIGLLAALVQRNQTGMGQKVTSGLFETTVFLVGQWMAEAGATGRRSIPMPELGQSRRMGWGIYDLMECADGEHVFVAVTSNQHWERFCTEFGLPDLFADPRLATNIMRAAERDWLIPRLRQELRQYDSATLQGRLEQVHVPYAPVQRPDQLLDDPHLNAADQLLATPFPARGTIRLPKPAFRSSRYAFSLRQPPPGLGEHTGDILQELGYEAARIEALESAGIVATGGPKGATQ